jgi:hypothetical protein
MNEEWIGHGTIVRIQQYQMLLQMKRLLESAKAGGRTWMELDGDGAVIILVN